MPLYNKRELDAKAREYGFNRDMIKIEINYSLRAHLLPAEERGLVRFL